MVSKGIILVANYSKFSYLSLKLKYTDRDGILGNRRPKEMQVLQFRVVRTMNYVNFDCQVHYISFNQND